MKSCGARLLASIWIASFLACIAIDLFYFPRSTTFGDENRFFISAEHLARTGEFDIGGDHATDMPGSAIFFAVFIRVFGTEHALIAIRFAQALLVILQSALIGVMARRIFDNGWTACVASALTAFYPFFIYYQGLALSETLFNTFLVAAFACLYWWRDRGMRIDGMIILASLCFAAATMTRATLTIFPPFLFAIAILARRFEVGRTLQVFAVSALAYCVFLSPWWVRNYAVFGAFVPFTTSSALNFYLGNNPANPNAGVNWSVDVEVERVKTTMAIPDEIARDRAFRQAALEYIREQPAAFFHRMGLKFLRYWNVVPNTEQFQTPVFRLISIASFGPMLLFAIICVILQRKHFAALVPIYALIVYFTLLHMIVIASLRYRLPLEPFLILLAAHPIARAIQSVRGRAHPVTG